MRRSVFCTPPEVVKKSSGFHRDAGRGRTGGPLQLAPIAMTDATAPVRFGPYALDPANARLTVDGRPLELPPKAFDVLCQLAARPGQLLSKDALLDAVWGHRFVSESVLKMAIVAIRQQLGDDPKAPRYVETVARRGYRFLPEVQAIDALPTPSATPMPATPTPADPRSAVRGEAAPVALDDGLTALDTQWRLALAGQRRLLMVSGDAGMGKSTLLRRWRALREADALLGGGQCVEQYGAGEPYLPLLDALNDLAGGPARPALVAALRGLAPTWWAQLPWLVPPEERAALQEAIGPASASRMMRELGELLDALSRQAPLVLLLEDLHWADQATVQALDFLARRRGGARLLIVGTARAGELAETGHALGPAWQEWRAQRLCEHWALTPWQAAHIERYVLDRLNPGAAAGARVEPALVRALLAHTDGLPLFVASIVEELHEGARLQHEGGTWRASAELLERLALPERVAAMIERQIARLPGDLRALLEAASVAGMRFDLQLLAAALDEAPDAVQARCDALARRGYWLRTDDLSPQPGAPLAVRYRFSHALRHRVFYERTAPAWRMALHRRLAALLARQDSPDDPAPQALLALHHARGLQAAEAAQAYQRASLLAERRQAHHEAQALAGDGLAQLALLPVAAQAEHAALHRVLELQQALNLMLLHGAADARAAAAAERSLQRHAGEAGSVDWMSACRAVLLAEHAQGRFDDAALRAQAAVATTRAGGDPAALYSALGIFGRTLFKCGRFDEARVALEEALAMEGSHGPLIAQAEGHGDLSVIVRCFLLLLDTLQQQPPRWDCTLPALLQLSNRLAAPLTRIWSHLLAAMQMLWCDAPAAAGEAMAAAAQLARRLERDFAQHQQAMVQAWAEAEGGAALATAWSTFDTAYRAYSSGPERHLESGFFALLRARLQQLGGQTLEADATAAAALEQLARSGERCHAVPLWLLRARLAASIGRQQASAECQAEALRLAREQGAALFARWAEGRGDGPAWLLR